MQTSGRNEKPQMCLVLRAGFRGGRVKSLMSLGSVRWG
jgi:hypothetical protein